MNKARVCVLDFGCGNVRSVYNMLSLLSGEVCVSNEPEAIRSASHIILPGVGAFGASMDKIKKWIPLDVLENEVLEKGKPFLGICVGMQVMAERGYEFGEHEGLGWIQGEVVKHDSRELSLPHIGWNSIDIVRASFMLKRFESNQDFYFVHSFVFREKNRECRAARTHYGTDFTSMVQKDNIFGVQFHPEKSQKAGKILLKNFLEVS